MMLVNHLYELPGKTLTKELINIGDLNKNKIIDIDDIMKLREILYAQ